MRTTSFVFLILIGAHIFSPFLALTGIPAELAEVLSRAQLPRSGVPLIFLAAFILMGMFLEDFAILVLTLPILRPVITTLRYDPIGFGVVMVIVLEMGLIGPPVGVNVFVVKGIARDVPPSTIYRGILPFWLAMIVCLVILVAFRQIALLPPILMIR